MKTPSFQWLAAGALATMICVAGLSADAAEAKEIKLPNSRVEAVDFTNMTFIVVAKETNLTVRITSETRFFLKDKPALSKDLQPGDHVRGTLRQPAEGPPEALRLHLEKPAAK